MSLIPPIDNIESDITPKGSPLAEALSKAQGEIKNPAKTSENPHFKSSYANLATGLDTIRPVLSKHGLSLVQVTRVTGEWLTLYTTLEHSSGEKRESEWPLGKVGTPPQTMMGALTYGRRATGFAIVGIAGQDDDDDGNAAQAASKSSSSPPPPPKWKFDFEGFEKWIKDCNTVEEINAAYDKAIKKYGRQMSEIDIADCQALVLDTIAKLDSDP